MTTAAPLDIEPGMDPDAYYTDIAMRALAHLVPAVLADAPESIRQRFDNALLNVAVNRLVEAEGRIAAATILWRLADVLQDGRLATPHRPADLTGCDDMA